MEVEPFRGGLVPAVSSSVESMLPRDLTDAPARALRRVFVSWRRKRGEGGFGQGNAEHKPHWEKELRTDAGLDSGKAVSGRTAVEYGEAFPPGGALRLRVEAPRWRLDAMAAAADGKTGDEGVRDHETE